MTSGWRATGILFAVFGAGGLAGAAVVEAVHEDAPAVESRGRRGGPPETSARFGDSDRFVRFLQSRLEITEEQGDRIREILARNGEEAGSLYESIRPRLESGVEEARAQIRDVLTADQLEKFDAVMSEERGRRRGGRARGPDGSPGPGPSRTDLPGVRATPPESTGRCRLPPARRSPAVSPWEITTIVAPAPTGPTKPLRRGSV